MLYPNSFNKAHYDNTYCPYSLYFLPSTKFACITKTLTNEDIFCCPAHHHIYAA